MADNKEDRSWYWNEPPGAVPLACSGCKFFLEQPNWHCPAFPDGLPDEVLTVKHNHILHGQVGDYVFTPKE